MIIKIYDDGRMAEIIINSAVKPPVSVVEFVRMLTAYGIGAAKIIKLKPATGEPVINVARNTKETTNAKT